MTSTLAASGSTGSPLWFLTRSSALIGFVLLTVTVLLGVLTTRQSTRPPRFVSQALHRNATLVALGLIVVHVLTTVLDNYVPIGWYAAFVPFTAGYRTSWVAAGATAFDLLLLLTLTSLLRVRVGHRLWRVVHWLAYGLWPLALVHYLGAGTDARTGWGRWLAIVAAVAVAGAIAVRVSTAATATEQAPVGHPVRGAPVRGA